MKVSKKKIDANRLNGKKGGPKTQAGKARSSMNAMRHGIFSRNFVITTIGYQESEEEYRQILEGIRNDLKPRTFLGNCSVEEIAKAKWRIRRLDTYEKAVTEQGLIASRSKEYPLAENCESLYMVDYIADLSAADLNLIGKDFRMVENHIAEGLGDEHGIHEKLAPITHVRLETRVAEERGNTNDCPCWSQPGEDRGQIARPCLLAGLSAIEILRYLDNVLAKKTSEYLESYRFFTRRIDKHQKHLNQQTAVLPSSEKLQLIVRYRDMLYRTIERQLELLWAIEKYRTDDEDTEITDAEFSDEPSDRNESKETEDRDKGGIHEAPSSSE